MCAQHFWGFPLNHPAFFGIFTLPPGNFLGFLFYHPALLGIPTLPPAGRKKERFPTHQPLSKTKLSVQT